MNHSAQYFPGEIPTPYGPAQARERKEVGKDRTILYVGIGVAAIILILVIVIVLFPSEKPDTEDDGFDINRTNPEDSAYCGNGKCDIDENSKKCCADCGCPLDSMECKKGECAFIESEMTDEEAERIAEEYAESKGIDPYLVRVSGTGTYGGLPCKFVVVKTFEEGFMVVAVLEDGTATEAGNI